MVKVEKKVYDQLEEIRESGEINMFNCRGVMEIARNKRYFHLLDWLDKNRNQYLQGVLEGFEAI